MYTRRRNKTNDQNILKIGDVVIIKDDDKLPQCHWRTAKVDKLVISKDGKVCGAKLSSISKEGKRTKLTQSLQKLVHLEVVDDDEHEKCDLILPSFIDDNNIRDKNF